AQLAEMFEFASRLAVTEAGDERMHVNITIRGLGGRALGLDDPDAAGFFRDYVAAVEAYTSERELTREELVGNSRELAVNVGSELFDQFGWTPSPEELRALQPLR